MNDELMLIAYWLLLCGPAALGAWALWWDYRGGITRRSDEGPPD